jgi:diguanylate cyclase (GGDEF)-like protein/PAS domain S-box-containing protein
MQSVHEMCHAQRILEATIKSPTASALRVPQAALEPSVLDGTPQALLDTILDLASAAIGTEHGWLYEFDSSIADSGVEVLICKAARGAFVFDMGQRRNRGEGISGLVVQTGLPLLLEDYDSWTGKAASFPSGVLGSAIGVPIKVGGRAVGMIGLGRLPGEAVLSSNEVMIVEKFAAMASLALENSHLHTSAQHELSHRGLVELELRTSESRFRSLVDSLDGVIWEALVHQAGLSFISSSVERLLGYPQEAWYSTPDFWRDHIHPDDRKATVGRASSLKENQQGVQSEYRMIASDGREVWIRDVITLVIEPGEPPKQRGVMLDVTDLKRTQTRTLLEAAMVNANDAITITEISNEDENASRSRIVFANQAFGRLYGYEPQEIVGLNPSVFYGINSSKRTQEQIVQQLERDEPVVTEILEYRKNGSTLWVELAIAPVRDETGTVRHRISTRRDITARKQSERLESDRAHVLELLVRGEPLEIVLRALTQLLEHQRPDWRSMVFAVTDNKISTLAAPSLNPDFLARFQDESRAGTYAPYRQTIETGKITTIQISQLESDHQALFLNEDIRSVVAQAAFSASGAFVANTCAFRSNDDPVGREDAELLELVSQLASVAIEQRVLHEKLNHQARHDALTGLPNRLQFDESLRAALEHSRAGHGSNTNPSTISTHGVSLLFIDLDSFKHVNDTLGHAAGDELLQTVAERLRTTLEPGDMIARMGGDEFAMIIETGGQANIALSTASRALEVLRKPLTLMGRELFVTASIGIAAAPSDGEDASTLSRNADIALYRAKALGKDGVQCYESGMNAAWLERVVLERRLRNALEHDEFQVHYQAQVDLEGQIVALEALLRWQSNDQVLLPDQFLQVAIETGLVTSIDQWVLRQVCEQAVRWQRAGYRPVRMAVNVTALQFSRPDFVESVALALHQSTLGAQFLELELTEGVLMTDVEGAVKHMNALHDLGVSLSIDDFGTGYSSLRYLQRLPLDALKIDRSFVHELEPLATKHPLLQVIIDLARQFDLDVVAEGIETREQYETLRRLGCDRLQGFWFNRPLEAQAMELLLQRTDGPKRSLLPNSLIT